MMTRSFDMLEYDQDYAYYKKNIHGQNITLITYKITNGILYIILK
jgi:hypothetical protein